MFEPRLIVDHDSTTPLYLQLKNQLAYLVISGQLETGQRLPAVREMADELGLNPGTVTQAYRELKSEGLAHGRRGSGTFVTAPRTDADLGDGPTRIRLLRELLEDALGRAVSLGFTLDEIHHHLGHLASQGRAVRRTAFVAPTPQVANKYARRLESLYAAQELDVRPLTLNELEAGDPDDLLAGRYFVLALASVHGPVRRAVGRAEGAYHVLPISTQVTNATFDALTRVDKGLRVGLVAEPGNVHSALQLLATHASIEPKLPTVLGDEPDAIAELCNAVDLVIHTYSAHEVLDALSVPHDRRLELQFEIRSDALASLARVFGPGRERRPTHDVHTAVDI